MEKKSIVKQIALFVAIIMFISTLNISVDVNAASVKIFVISEVKSEYEVNDGNGNYSTEYETLEYFYNADGTIKTQKYKSDSGSPRSEITYKYDKNKRMIESSVDGGFTPENSIITITYDYMGGIAGLVNSKKYRDYKTITSYKYDSSGKIVKSNSDNSIVKYTYDSSGRIIKESLQRKYTNGSISEWQDTTYTYNSHGDVESYHGYGPNNSGSYTYTYAEDGRVASCVKADKKSEFIYKEINVNSKYYNIVKNQQKALIFYIPSGISTEGFLIRSNSKRNDDSKKNINITHNKPKQTFVGVTTKKNAENEKFCNEYITGILIKKDKIIVKGRLYTENSGDVEYIITKGTRHTFKIRKNFKTKVLKGYKKHKRIIFKTDKKGYLTSVKYQ